ncbi:MAG: family acetyltransferase [Frondihabitans sp.]|nr:family acetyltransferase [Frondihabitans sp.]
MGRLTPESNASENKHGLKQASVDRAAIRHHARHPGYALWMVEILVRPAVATDAAGMAAVHVQSWRETYRGLVADSILDRPASVARRERFWSSTLAADDATERAAVAVQGGHIVGIASSGPPRDSDATWPTELYVLYLLADAHGSGAGARLLESVVTTSEASLWVADPNPRAQAFYRKHGFVPDGAAKDDGIPEIRMVRR